MILSGLCAYFCEVKPLTTYNHRISFPCGQQTPFPPSMFFCLVSFLFAFCYVPFYLFVSYLFLLFVLQRHFMPTIIRPFPSALSSISMPPLGIVLLRSGRGAVGEVLERREQKFCRTCQQLDAIINWKRCPAHVACSMEHNGVCAGSLSSSYLLFPPASGWLSSVVVIPPDWWLPKRFLTRTCRVCCLPLQPPVCLFLCFRLWHCRQQLDALAWRALKYPGCSVSNVFDESWSRQQAAQSRRCHMWSQYVNASNYLWFHALWHLFIIRWIIFGNSIPLSHQTEDETSYKSIWKTKEVHQTWLHCQEGTHLSEKVSADIGNMHKLNKISSCQKLFTLFAIVRHELNNIGLSIDIWSTSLVK